MKLPKHLQVIIALLVLLQIYLAISQHEVNTTHTTSFVVFPQDCNSNPPMLFGGKILSEMDRCAGITARRFLYASPNGTKDAVTVGINNVKFHKAGQVKDLLFITGTVTEVGTKSIKMKVKVEREVSNIEKELIADGEFVFVAYDLKEKKAVPHGIIWTQK